MEEVRAEVGLVRPDNGPQLRINPHLSKELRVLQRTEDAAAPEDSRREIDDSPHAVGESQFKAIGIKDSRLGDGRTKLNHKESPYRTYFLFIDRPGRPGRQVMVELGQERLLVRAGKRAGGSALRNRGREEAILKDIVAIADGYNMSIRTALLADDSTDGAILSVAKRRKNNLIVLGVGRRPGEKLFFGDTAAALLEKSERSLLFVAS